MNEQTAQQTDAAEHGRASHFPLPPADDAPTCLVQDVSAGVWLYQADCLDLMDRLIALHPNGLFDMIFADPPYFLSNGGDTCHAGRRVKVDKGEWDQSQGVAQNHAFNHAWLRRCRQLLKPNGTLWVSGTHHVIHSIGYAIQQLEMKLLNNITWEKPNPPPNLSRRYFTHSTETLLWAAKNAKAKHRFNYDAMRAANDGKQMKTVWTFTAPNGREKQLGKHPTQKPEALLERLILASTAVGDLIFDPFAGSGTTGVVAVQHSRRFVGAELDAAYAELAARRLARALAAGRALTDRAAAPAAA